MGASAAALEAVQPAGLPRAAVQGAADAEAAPADPAGGEAAAGLRQHATGAGGDCHVLLAPKAIGSSVCIAKKLQWWQIVTSGRLYVERTCRTCTAGPSCTSFRCTVSGVSGALSSHDDSTSETPCLQLIVAYCRFAEELSGDTAASQLTCHAAGSLRPASIAQPGRRPARQRSYKPSRPLSPCLRASYCSCDLAIPAPLSVRHQSRAGRQGLGELSQSLTPSRCCHVSAALRHVSFRIMCRNPQWLRTYCFIPSGRSASAKSGGATSIVVWQDHCSPALVVYSYGLTLAFHATPGR